MITSALILINYLQIFNCPLSYCSNPASHKRFKFFAPLFVLFLGSYPLNKSETSALAVERSVHSRRSILVLGKKNNHHPKSKTLKSFIHESFSVFRIFSHQMGGSEFENFTFIVMKTTVKLYLKRSNASKYNLCSTNPFGVCTLSTKGINAKVCSHECVR